MSVKEPTNVASDGGCSSDDKVISRKSSGPGTDDITVTSSETIVNAVAAAVATTSASSSQGSTAIKVRATTSAPAAITTANTPVITPAGVSTTTAITPGGGGTNQQTTTTQQQPKGKDSLKLKASRSIAWICCAPCVFCRTSTLFRRTAFTTLTLVVTSLLVMSPILFLTQFALPARDCQRMHCIPKPHKTTPTTCDKTICINAASGIQARMNFNVDPCYNFEGYCCSNNHTVSLYSRFIQNSQEKADSLMETLITQNTTSGIYRKLGRLYGSCLRQNISARAVLNVLNDIGGLVMTGALLPASLTDLFLQFNRFGFMPVISYNYEISTGRRPRIELVLEMAYLNAHVLEGKLRWDRMKPPSSEHIFDYYDDRIVDELVKSLLPKGLNKETLDRETYLVHSFIHDVLKMKYFQSNYGNNTVMQNMSILNRELSYLEWNRLLPDGWKGPIIIRCIECFQNFGEVLNDYDKHVIQNGLVILFALHTLPRGFPTQATCAKATSWAMPEASSALMINYYNEEVLQNAITRVEHMFEALKAHIKRAPTLRGRALVQLSALKIIAQPWPELYNHSYVEDLLGQFEFSSDNWFENVLKIYQVRNQYVDVSKINVTVDDQIAWAYPLVAKPFYDPTSHAVIVPASLLMMPFFDEELPKYIHYSTVGVQIAKEIFSVTKTLEDKLKLKCAPNFIIDSSKYNRKSLLTHGAALQIAYHALLHQSGSLERIHHLDMNPMQVMMVVAAQDFIEEELYYNYDYNTSDINQILAYVISQGGTGSKVFSCPNGSLMNQQKTCDVW